MRTPTVLVAIAHEPMRRLIADLLAADHRCWSVHVAAGADGLPAALTAGPPDLVVVDAADFARCCRDSLGAVPAARMVVIAPEPDGAYRTAARRQGAGGWLSRDAVAEEIAPQLRRALGCRHDPCPSTERKPAR